MGYTTYLPIVGGGSGPVDLHPEVVKFAYLLIDNQNFALRKNLYPNKQLFLAAQFKAEDMVSGGYEGHIEPNGRGPNNMAIAFGFPLPPWYRQGPEHWGANSIESLSGGHPTAEDSWKALINSEGHRRHLLAQGSFFRQNNYGIGFESSRGYWCILISEKNPIL